MYHQHVPHTRLNLFHVDAGTIRVIKTRLSESSRDEDKTIARFLQDYRSISVGQLGIAAMSAGALQVVEERGGALAFMTSWEWGQKFIETILAELREIICSPKKHRGNLSRHTQAIIAAIVTMLMHKFGMQSATANGIAVLILLTLGRATKKAFCKMTDAEVLEALSK
jgi:hypothetical protein